MRWCEVVTAEGFTMEEVRSLWEGGCGKDGLLDTR